MEPIVIVGGGHAAAQLCISLAEGGSRPRVILISRETHLPYHRPPLSKTLIKEPAAALPELRGAAFYAEHGIELRLGTEVQAIDRFRRKLAVRDANGTSELDYGALVIATGARARQLPALADARNVHTLRSFDDAVALRAALSSPQRIAVIGGGFIGLELAATARAMGHEVTVFEAAPRLLVRAVSQAISAHLKEVHERARVQLCIGQAPEAFERDGDRVVAVRWQGQSFAVDRLIVGIGAEPEVELARAAGLACDNGIAVDANLATGDPHIFAIGDCTSFPFSGARVRLESVQNANDQARALAQRLSGKDAAYQPVPTFWSDQGEARLQIAGLWQPAFDAVLRPGARAGSFSVFHYDGPSLRAVESINAPMDHLAAKGWLQRGHSPAREAVADTARPLKSL